MATSEELKRLDADLASDKELKKKYYETIDRIANDSKPESDGELFAKAAAELGYSISAADFERLDAENEEVSADELETASGGKYRAGCQAVASPHTEDEYGHDGQCIAAFHCYIALMHTESSDERVSCWKDYRCVVINH